MKFNEIRDVFKNVENNNNIITRNTYARNFGKPITGNESDTISTRNPDGIPILNTTNNGGGIMVGNPTTASTTTNICIKTSDSLFFTKATAYVELHNSLYTQWYTTSNTLSGLTHISGNFFKITSANACLNAVGLPPHFVAPIDYHFGYINKDDRFTNEKFEVSVRQLDNANLLLGECIYVITDNPFVEPYKEFIETDTTLPICYWAHDNNAKNTATFTVSNALPYTISNGTTILSPSITHEYTLTEGEYIVTANDSNANIDYVTYLHVVDNGIDTAETINPISFNCDNTTVTWGAESSDYLVFDKNYIQQTPVTGNQYDLDAMEGKYYEIHNDISGCKVDKRKLEMQDLIYLPESRIALMLADYDLAEDTCCTIELNELNCNDQPLSLNENIAIYNTNLEYLFTAPIQQIGSTSQGFKFCPPYWDTTSAHINHLQSIVYKSSTCQYCRIDFKCDNSVEFDKQTSLNSIKNSDVLVFPNPTENTINVLLTNATNKGTIILLDAIGKEVLRTTFESTTNKLQTIDVSQLPSGVYTIYLPELSIYKKVVIVK